MAARLFRIILPVSDINAASAFYAGILEHQGMRVSEGRHYFKFGETILACLDAKADGDDVEFQPNPEWLYFAVADLEATYSRCQAAGATLTCGDVHDAPAGEIHTRPWGERSFYCQDPFGNKICFVDETTIFSGR